MVMSSMDEGRRQAYLASLGLPLWTARHDVPGASPSSLLVFEPFLRGQPEIHPVGPEMVQQDSAEPVVSAAVAPAPIASVTPTRPAVAAVPASDPIDPALEGQIASTTPSATRFTLRVQALAPGWLGVVALGDVPDLSASEHRLLAAISHALGASPDFSGSTSLLRWPLNNNPRMDHSEAAAIDWLRNAMKIPEGSRCVVLGEAISVLIRTALPASTVMVAGPSLATLLATPLAKKSLWLSLHV